ncbi:alpha/beta-hydrolase [Teratosphaeria nubilosa]|uniref:Carboxylic ester hydrolase n=1 Tax=Teratosphaeria nubilosa TaxID=161662 RepID=A0A6G1LAR2_9PEZI|nr:alpha/beta-hydrolase [Teratosphaeria nubilosa]
MIHLPSASALLLYVLATVDAAEIKRQIAATAATADTKNGTYAGYYAPAYNADNFLGIPYAQPPVGSLRFHVPLPLNTSWSGVRNATQYGPECIGYGLDTESQGNYVSEDCLTLNVICSRGAGDKLPVLVWIHGGGLVEGGSADHRYNQSFIVQQSAEAGMPIVAVSINYRLSAWGFLYGQAIQDSGNTMNGFRDQRLALHWVQENIEAFGGDPNRVTIQGESAGGASVGAQLLAYNGRDDRLFAHAIAESGAPVSLSPYPTVQSWESVIANITKGVGCANTSDVLACLRAVDIMELNAVINSTATAGADYGAVIDGDFIVEDSSTQLERGNFVHVPYIIGCNTDEGTSFGPKGINTTAQFLAYIISDDGVDKVTAQDLAILYPDIPAIGIPATLAGRPNSTVGLQYKRTSAVVGDISMHAPRRLTAQEWASHNATVYTYRFNVLVNGQSYIVGSPHFQEVAFVFYNTEGYGYPQNLLPNPLGGVERPEYLKLAQLMVRMWIGFVNYGDPNKHLGVDAEHWPVYTIDDPQNFVFEQNVTSHSEPDLYRAEGIKYISDLIKARRRTDCSGLVACGADAQGGNSTYRR